jgi:hypothetical protein
VWFRGFLGRGLLGRYGPTGGILITSLLFGLVHGNPVQSLYAVVLGLALHLIYRATRSLWVPILIHFLFNAMAVGLSALAVATAKAAPAAPIGTTEVIIGYAILGVLMAVSALAGWGLYRRRVKVAEQA